MIFSKLLAALMAAGMTQSAFAQAPEGYELVWADEFNTNTIGKNWTAEVVAEPSNNELQYYTARKKNVDVRDGYLVLKTCREEYGDKNFTSARLNSMGKVTFTHGVLEARINMPPLDNGLWPAFWLMGDDIATVNWPRCGEIDVTEAGHMDALKQGVSDRWISANLHWGQHWKDDHHMVLRDAYVAPFQLTEGWHSFFLEWDEDSLRCYVDSPENTYYKVDVSKQTEYHDWFHKPFHILFNMAVGGDFTGIQMPHRITAVPDDDSPVEMFVDYVRLYQRPGQKNVKYKVNDAQ